MPATKTPHAPAISVATKQLHALLAQKEFDPFDAVFLAEFRYLLDASADPNIPDVHGTTTMGRLLVFSAGEQVPEQALEIAAAKGGVVNSTLVSELIIFDQVDRALWALSKVPHPDPSLLQDAVLWSTRLLDMLPALLAAGIPINTQDDSGCAILHLLNNRRGPVLLEVVEYCLDHGADPTLENNIGITPLEGATPEMRGILEAALAARALTSQAPPVHAPIARRTL